jgi:hypothetical protein
MRPDIWASLRSDSGLPARALNRYAATVIDGGGFRYRLVTLPAGGG